MPERSDAIMIRRGVAYALLSAVLFGISTPLAKVLVGTVPPLMLAGLLYGGSGLGLAIVLARRRDRVVRRGGIDVTGPR